MACEGDVTICRCEAVSLGTIVSTIETYQCSAREVKLRTRAGMGYCGGRTCRPMVEQIVESVLGRPVGDDTDMSYRPPVRPVTFGELGGGR